MNYKIYGAVKSVQVRKCLAVAQQTSTKMVVVNKTTNDTPPTSTKSKPAKFVSPFDTLPVLTTNRGTICGSNAICQYIAASHASEGLVGDCFETAQAAGFLSTLSNELETAVYRKQILNDESATADITTFLGKLETHFAKRTYAVSERRSFADVAAAVVVHQASEYSPLEENVKRWLKSVTADVKAHAKAGAKPSSPKSNRNAKKTVAKKTETSTEAPVVAAEPAEPAAPSTPFDMGNASLVALDVKDFPNPPAEPKESAFVLDAWKREYSNCKDLYGAGMEYFWQNFDSEGWTLWKFVYDKVEGEGEKDYLTSNLLNGFLQRMDPASRKNGFGVCSVLGAEGDFNYSGVFLFRGSDMPLFMLDHPSFEYHKFAKLDHTSDEHKKIVADYWCAEETIDGVTICDSKQFK